ncbi:hypothetical protein [Undibacterium flavidum]|uniref:Uncharacterized protein n=1 Tax=Undibacterium flavidum TaxID=2762297 RepID=A0ABR6YEG0_9BURK|nr:hypothetical protein [Undibacterium flavidum]MBC3874894.1 hypothetical protein [Undibacterium flavidum]
MFNGGLKNQLNAISRLFWPSSVTITLTGSTITAQQHAKSSKSHVAVHYFTHHAGAQSELFYAEVDAFLQQLFSQPSWQKRGTSIVLGADLVRYFLVQPFSNARHLQDSIDAATHRFQQLYGKDDLKEWDIQGHWSIDQRFLACAVPKKLLQQLQQCAQHSSFQIDAITPQFVFAWNCLHHHLSARQWLLLNEGTHLVLGMLDHTGLVSVRVIARQVQTNTPTENLTEILKREALSFDLPLPETVVLCGAMEAQWIDCKQPAIIQSGKLKKKNIKGRDICTTPILTEQSV